MTAVLRNRKFVINYPNDYYLKPRSEGRIKSYDSCTDIRAWSLHEDERSDHLFDLIKIDNEPCYGLIPKGVLADILAGIRGKEPSKGDNAGMTFAIDSKQPGTSSTPSKEREKSVAFGKDVVGDSKENELELKKIIAAKDKEIAGKDKELAGKDKELASLLKEINDLKVKCKEGVHTLTGSKRKASRVSTSTSAGASAAAESEATIQKLNEQIKKLHDEIKKLKEDIGRSTSGGVETEALLKEKDGKIENLESIIREITAERDALQKINADLAKDLEEFKVHLDSLNNLTKELNNYANKAHSMKGNGQKYAELLEAFKVTLDEDVANAKVAAGELKKERKQLEEQIKSQLDEALEMYIAALEEIQKKQLELDKLSKDLVDTKIKNDELLKKCSSAPAVQMPPPQIIQTSKRDSKPPEKTIDVPKRKTTIVDEKAIIKSSQNISPTTETNHVEEYKVESPSYSESKDQTPESEDNGRISLINDTHKSITEDNEEIAVAPKVEHTLKIGDNMCQMNNCTAKCCQKRRQLAEKCPNCNATRRLCISSIERRSESESAINNSQVNETNALTDAIRKTEVNHGSFCKKYLSHELNNKHVKNAPSRQQSKRKEEHESIRTHRIIHENWDFILPQSNNETGPESQEILDCDIQFPNYNLMIRMNDQSKITNDIFNIK